MVKATAAAGTSSPPSSRRVSPPRISSSQMDGIAQELASRVSEELPAILYQLTQQGFNPEDQPLRLLCHLTPAEVGDQYDGSGNQVEVASVDLGRDFTPVSSTGTPQRFGLTDSLAPSFADTSDFALASNRGTWPARNSPDRQSGNNERPRKRQKQVSSPGTLPERPSTASSVVRRDDVERRVQPRKRITDNPALQPSSLDKLINGIWDSLFSGVRMDPTEIIEQWQAIESSGQPQLLTDTEQDVSVQGTGAFGRMSKLTRKISQTMRACRSLEVIVQAHWIQCFDNRVAELTQTSTREKAKKDALCEACVDFGWTEKELRNKMAIWRGYHDIQKAAGWAALVFSGMGLYRFCKYRVSFTEETYRILRALRHRFEVAADTLHPRWRTLLGIVGNQIERKYTGHPHDWVVNGPDDQPIPLRQTYARWDKNFTYVHLANSEVDTEVWGDFDPRMVAIGTHGEGFKCHACGQEQSDHAVDNSCQCYSNLYGSPKATVAPVQVYRTPNGKNNGLLACCAFEKGSAVGEFVGQITTGIRGLDVMVDRTERASYQLYQGKKGNHTRFVNHSCEPNSHYERFVWMGKQRTVLVSDGIAAGEEITVDYGPTYWEDLDKECLCGKPNCRYKGRQVKQLVTPPNGGR